MKKTITVSQLLQATDLGFNAAEHICMDYLHNKFDAMSDPLSAVIIKAHQDNMLESNHDNMISDIEHTIHQLKRAVKFINEFTIEDELLTADFKYKSQIEE